MVDRRFNRRGYDADTTVAAFSARLRDAVDLETVRVDLLAVVKQAVEPAHAVDLDQPCSRRARRLSLIEPMVASTAVGS